MPDVFYYVFTVNKDDDDDNDDDARAFENVCLNP